MKKFISKKKNTYLVLLLSLILVLAGCGNSKKAQYREDAENVTEKIFSNSVKAEEVIDSYSSIWSLTINNGKYDITIEQMAHRMGLTKEDVIEHFHLRGANNEYVSSDFSDNIHSLKSYYESNGTIEGIKITATEIKELVSSLNQPPKGFEDVYNEILDLYSLSEEYVSMVTNPSGSLREFNENANRLSSEILTKYKRIEVVMPSE